MKDKQSPKQTTNLIPAIEAESTKTQEPELSHEVCEPEACEPKVRKQPFSYWLKKNRYYHHQMKKFYRFVVPEGKRVLQIGCKNGYLLNEVRPSVGVGIDDDADFINQAATSYPEYRFFNCGLDELCIDETFDYIILSSIMMETYDIQELFTYLQRFCNRNTRIVIDSYSKIWEPVLWATQKLNLRRPTDFRHSVSRHDIEQFLSLTDYEVVSSGRFTLMPLYIPFVSTLLNSFLGMIPGINRLCLNEFIIARPKPKPIDPKSVSVSVIITCKNERGNVEDAILRTPQMGKSTEYIFIEGGSSDGTLEEMQRVVRAYPEKNISYYKQDGSGKGDAVRKGFARAKGDILMILDGDLTTPPEEMPKFFAALCQGRGDLINGSRMIYGMESKAMRFLNVLANYFFSALFSWLLSQKVKDTLCGTKVLFKDDYDRISANRAFFGNFDPFGDFDLLFGAAKLNMKICDMPVHYKNRQYGTTQIRRFMHGWILLGMSLLALKKFKLR